MGAAELPLVAWVVTAPAGKSWFTDYTRALNYARHVHGVLSGPMDIEQARAIVLAHQRALLDGASPMESH